MTITTGLKTLDDLIGGGLQPGSLTLYAGVSQSGMTTMLDTTVCGAALKDRTSVLLADLEAGDRQSRILSAHSGVKLVNIQRGTLTDHDAERLVLSSLDADGASLRHTTSRRIPELLAEAMDTEAKLIAIDGARYVQPWPGGGSELAQILIALKALGRDQGAAVVVTAPVNRDQVRPGDSPTMGLLSPEVGLNCDVVVFLERWGSFGSPETGPEDVDLIVAKNRYGQIGRVRVIGDYLHARFLDVEFQGDLKAA